ncbi:MAG: Glu/Leu/Phe/Val dehydrogenase [Gemmatimonadetes bacterium]|nr:Glu/Leu/Phe/Val dehydrogenase [Gemmatimonadota bacterium]
MKIFDLMTEGKHEQIVFWSEPELGYRGIIAIHDTTLGPALGGTRFWNYASGDEALLDALRLSKGMTQKAAVTGLDLGGGKSVIWGDNRTEDREMVLRAHGRAVESLGGRYITAVDVGTSSEDMEYMRMETEHVVGLPTASGDPSPVTAFGVFQGIRAAIAFKFGGDDLEGRHVAVQGLGNVGYSLCRFLAEAGARLTVADIVPERVAEAGREFGAGSEAPERIHAVEADVFAPCALGGVLNDDTISELQVSVVAGAANNQLQRSAKHATVLREAGILYAPDYVANAGGLIHVYGELRHWGDAQVRRKVSEIRMTLLGIFEVAAREGISPNAAANRVVEERIRRTRHLERTFLA